MTGLSLRNDWFEQAFLLLVMLAGAASVKAGLAMPSSPWEVIGKGAFPTALGGARSGAWRPQDAGRPAPGRPV